MPTHSNIFYILLLSLLIQSCSTSKGNAQVSDTSQQNIIPIEAEIIRTDKLGQIYIITPENDIVLLDKNRKERYRYTDNTLGNIYELNVDNPFNIMVFYRDLSTLVFLDRTLTPIITINLLSINLYNVSLASPSSDNNVWILEQDGNKLKKISRNGDLLFESQDLSLQIQSKFVPTRLIEANNQVLLITEKQGVIRFDSFGNYINSLSLNVNRHCFVNDNIIYDTNGSDIVAYDMKSLSENKITLKDYDIVSDLKMIQILNNNSFLLLNTKGEVYIFVPNK